MGTESASITCRNYQAADREACLEIFNQLTPMHFKSGELEDFTRFLDSLGDAPCRYAIIEKEGGDIIASGGMWFDNAGGVATLLWDMVRPDQQRQGIGRFMLATRMGWLSEHPQIKTLLASMSRHSAGFFEKEGFKTFNVQRDFFGPGVDLYEMKLQVGR